VSGWRVHKFGGSSVADAACLQRVARIVDEEDAARVAVVVSACGGVTDALLNLVSAAERQDETVTEAIRTLHTRHDSIARTLLNDEDAARYGEELDSECSNVLGLLQAVKLMRTASPTLRDIVAGFGELWSSRLVAAFLSSRSGPRRPVRWLDARDLIQVETGPLGPRVQWAESSKNAERLIPGDGPLTLIVPGFIARDGRGLQTTLGRNGSDFSAAILAALLDAAELSIWTDVDGVLTADPRRVPDATVIDAMSYHEAMELAYFGAKVLHPQTMAPAVMRNIPIRIRNTFAPSAPGTRIAARVASSHHSVKGITTIDHIALVNVEGAGMIGVPGTAQRLFAVLREHGISVILISQASSEHSICFAIPRSEAALAERVVRDAFASELRHGQIQRVEAATDCSILAVVGDGMAGTHGVAAKAFGSLADAGVNVRAIAQGASERNISVVISERETTKALRAVHSRFYLSPHTVSVGLIGPGLVGSALIEQVRLQMGRLHRDCNLDLRIRGILSSQRMLLADPSVPLDTDWTAALACGEKANLTRFEEHIHADHLPHTLLVDCTASEEVARQYSRWLAAGIHVVTPNKKAGSGPDASVRDLHAARRAGGTHFLYEATVGAALPVIQTLRDLRETGDDIRRVEGILSGTLSYLFNVWDGSLPFSTVLRDAMSKGYTEPDPRDDLSGADVARKLIILAREIGLHVELDDVELENLVPEALRQGPVEAFCQRMTELDQPMEERLRAARARDQVLRYVGVLDAPHSRVSVGLLEVERSHPFANINLTDNVVRFATGRYDRNPLVIQGPGAGPAVTAGAVFADILRVCAYLGTRL
jgi:aspartokinase/homoserine dehydrogenase 1